MSGFGLVLYCCTHGYQRHSQDGLIPDRFIEELPPHNWIFVGIRLRSGASLAGFILGAAEAVSTSPGGEYAHFTFFDPKREQTADFLAYIGVYKCAAAMLWRGAACARR